MKLSFLYTLILCLIFSNAILATEQNSKEVATIMIDTTKKKVVDAASNLRSHASKFGQLVSNKTKKYVSDFKEINWAEKYENTKEVFHKSYNKVKDAVKPTLINAKDTVKHNLDKSQEIITSKYQNYKSRVLFDATMKRYAKINLLTGSALLAIGLLRTKDKKTYTFNVFIDNNLNAYNELIEKEKNNNLINLFLAASGAALATAGYIYSN